MPCLKGCNPGNSGEQRRTEVIFVPPTFGVDCGVSMTLRPTYEACVFPSSLGHAPYNHCRPALRLGCLAIQHTPPSISDTPILGKQHSTTLLTSALRKLICGHHSCSRSKNPAGHNTRDQEREQKGEGLSEKELTPGRPETVDLRAPQLLQCLSAPPGLGWGNTAPF